MHYQKFAGSNPLEYYAYKMNNILDMNERMPPRAAPPGHAEQRPLHAAAIDRLRDMIVQGELAPRTKLNERVLCERLGTSRTPVREAIKHLASEGLVELLPNRGAIVASLDPQRVQEMFVMLGALEALAGELACRDASDAISPRSARCTTRCWRTTRAANSRDYFHCNQQIHIRLVACAGNATLTQTYRSLNAHVRARATWRTCRASAGTRRWRSTSRYSTRWCSATANACSSCCATISETSWWWCWKLLRRAMSSTTAAAHQAASAHR